MNGTRTTRGKPAGRRVNGGCGRFEQTVSLFGCACFCKGSGRSVTAGRDGPAAPGHTLPLPTVTCLCLLYLRCLVAYVPPFLRTFQEAFAERRRLLGGRTPRSTVRKHCSIYCRAFLLTDATLPAERWIGSPRQDGGVSATRLPLRWRRARPRLPHHPLGPASLPTVMAAAARAAMGSGIDACVSASLAQAGSPHSTASIFCCDSC
jgi:hypothetical protein